MSEETRRVVRPDHSSDPWFHQEDLRDAAFFHANKEAIHDAIRHGRIIPSKQATSLEVKRREASERLAQQATPRPPASPAPTTTPNAYRPEGLDA